MDASHELRRGLFQCRHWIFVTLFAVTGCLREDLVVPEPAPADPPPPVLLCSLFIKNGYTDKMSYYTGDTLKLFFESSHAVELCQLSVYDIVRQTAFTVPSMLPPVPALPSEASVDGFNYPLAASVIIPDLPSGVYLIENKIPFLVKTKERVDLTVIYPSNTANAYATSGGKSMYSSTDRPAAVSFQRPVPLQSLSEHCLKWFTSLTEFQIGYVADIDMDDFHSISNSTVLVVVGHSEYWTRPARENFDRFVDSGGHALILSGNTMWWQVRYSDDKQKLICYKNVDADPVVDPILKTIEWNSPSLDYSILSSIGAHFPYGGYGLRTDKGWNGYKVITPGSPLFEGLGLMKGDIIPLPSLEYDGAPIKGYDGEGFPILDQEALNFERAEIVAFDKGFRGTETTATFIVFQKSADSGIVVNTATTDWCSDNGIAGVGKETIRGITYNALKKLVHGAVIFSE